MSVCSAVGRIPTEIGRLTSLTLLSVSRNKLTGPATLLGRCKCAATQVCGRDLFIGPIPTELGHLTSATELYLMANDLTGASAFCCKHACGCETWSWR